MGKGILASGVTVSLIAVSMAGVTVVPAAGQAMAGVRRAGLQDTADAVVGDTGRGESVLRTKVTVRLVRAPLDRVVNRIARQAGFDVVFERGFTPDTIEVTLERANVTAGAALREALAGTALTATMDPDGRTLRIGIRRKRASSRRGGGSIVGQVTDSATGRGLAGAEILLDRTAWHTTTDTAGRYQVIDVDSGAYLLIARRVGYAKQTRRLMVRPDEETRLDVALPPAAVALNELVTTATGQQRRRDLGNAITTIRVDSVLRSAPIRSLTDLLENRVPGMTVQHTSGAPGDPARIRLRGLGSIVRGNDPVVIVDGMRLYATQSERRSGNLTNLDPSGHRANPVDVPAPSPLDQIDPNIIEKIEVFKGPSAATLYGADAANGVIVITTKKGKPGPARWTASLGRAQTRSLGRYGTAYFRWGRDLFTAIPRFCTITDATCVQDSLVQFQTLNTPNLTVLGGGDRNSASVTASGGSQALTYSVTGSYAKEVGLLTLPSFEVDRFQARFNRAAPDWMRRPHQLEEWSVSSRVTAVLSPSADISLNTTLSRREQGRTNLEQQLAPLAGTYVDSVNGIYYRPATNGYALNGTDAILGSYYVRQTASAINFTTGVDASVRPTPWFNGSAQASVNINPRDDQLQLPSGLVSATDSGNVVRGTGQAIVSAFNLQGSVRKPLRWGVVLQANLGANLTTTNTSDLVTSAFGLVPGTTAISGATHISATDKKANTSVFGWYIEPRLTGGRFALSTGVRLDGGNNYGTRVTNLLALPKLNGSWVISEEPWFPFKTLFSSLQLRGAYGQAQVQPGPADRLRLYTTKVDPQGDRILLTGMGNTDLRPERSVELEGGFNANLLDSRLVVDLTLYRKTQVDALQRVELPGSVNGGGSVVTNIGNIRNTGVELEFGLTPVRSSWLQWSAQLTLAHNANTLVKLGRGVEPNPGAGFVAGYPVGSRWAKPILGFSDANGDSVLQADEVQVGDSLVFMGRLLPNIVTAFSTNLALLGGVVGISADFSYDAGQTQIDQTAQTNWVLARALVDPRVPFKSQAAVLAMPRTNYGLMQTVSTFRFKALGVNVRAPAWAARLLRAQTLIVGLRGDNLGLHSNYRGKDPNVSAWSAGETIVDTGQLPMPRTWQLALNLQY